LYLSSLAEYRKLLDPPATVEHAFDNLLNLSAHPVTVSTQVFPTKSMHKGMRSTYKDGWSPYAIALKYQRIAILDILGHYKAEKVVQSGRILRNKSISILNTLV